MSEQNSTTYTTPTQDETQDAVSTLWRAGAHFVLCASDKRPIADGWEKPQNRPVSSTAVDHATRGGLLGFIPHKATLSNTNLSLVVVDVDVDKEASETARRTEAEWKAEEVKDAVGPPLCEITTPSLGVHLYYRADKPLPNSTWKMKDGSKGGEIRGGAGYVCLYDLKAVAAALDNLDDYDFADLDSWPFSQPRTAAPVADNRTYDDETVRDALTHIDPDITHDEWVRVGMALHAAGHDVALWTEWSANGGTFKPQECEQKWRTFSADKAGGVGMGTLIDMAKKGGWTPPRGRPRTTEPAAQTVANRKAQERIEMQNHAFDNAFPPHLCFDRPIETDVERLLTYTNDRLLAVDSKIHVANGSVWRRLSVTDERSMTALAKILGDSRAAAVAALPEETPTAYGVHIYELPRTAWHVRQIAETLKIRTDQVTGIPRQQFDDRNRYPLVPFTNGNCINLAANAWMKPAEALPCHISDHGWEIPFVEVNETHEEAKAIIDRQYGDELLDRVALYLAGSDKTCDVVRFPSNAGKTTFYDLMANAFPGAFSKENAYDVVLGNNRPFTPMETLLAHSAGVFLDEATHSEATLKASQLNKWDSKEVRSEEKYEKRVSVRRIGNVILLGAEEWPHVDASAQGYAARFRWAIDRMDVGEMPTKEWYVLQDEKAIAWFRAHMITRAVELIAKYGAAWIARKEQEKDGLVQAALHDLGEARVNPMIAALTSLLTRTNHPKDYVTPEQIIENLKASGDVPARQTPTKTALTKMMQTAFDDTQIKLVRTSIEGTKCRAYRGFTHA